MTGTNFGWGTALCGACTVYFNGVAIRSRIAPILVSAGQKITNLEALGCQRVSQAVQVPPVKHDADQCGYCQSGQVMGATAVLRGNTKPTDADIDAAMVGNVGLCGTYVPTRAAIQDAAASLA